MINYIDVTRKLIGPIDPVGETSTDNARFENLKAMTELVDNLISDIDKVASNKDCVEFSMKRAGEHASKFLDDFGIF